MKTSAFLFCALLVVAAVDAQTGPPLRASALDAINRSPRHGEWVGIEIASATPLRSWVMYPERNDKAPVIIVLHTRSELDDWTRAIADQLAADGAIAIAPELADVSAAAMSSRVEAVRAYARNIPAADGRTAVLVLDDRTPAIAVEWTPREGQILRVPADESGQSVQQRWPRVLAFVRGLRD